MPNIKKGNNWGFTLMELLLVTAFLAVVSLAIYATFNNGIKIWQKINVQVAQEDLDIFLEEFTVDLRNTFKFTPFIFTGEKEKVEFTTLVNSPKMHKYTVGKVSYFYDSESKIITRSAWDFSQIYEGRSSEVKVLVKNVESLKLQYYFYDKGTKEYFWFDEWAKEGFPLAVRVELSLKDNGQINGFVKTVGIPVSN